MKRDEHNPYEDRRSPGWALFTALMLALAAILIYLKREDIAELFSPGQTEVQSPVSNYDIEGVEGEGDVAIPVAEEMTGSPGQSIEPDTTARAEQTRKDELATRHQDADPGQPRSVSPAAPAVEPGPVKIRVESFREGDRVGFRREQDGEVVIEPQYERAIYHGTDPVAFVAVMKGGKYGIVSLENEVLLPFEYDNIGYIPKTKDYMKLLNTSPMKYGIVRARDMKVVIPAEYDGMSINWPFIAVSRGELWGTVDAGNREVVPIVHPGSPGFSSRNGENIEVWFRNSEGRIVSYDIKGNIVGVE